MTKAVDQMKRESIAGVHPCTVYRGFATAIQTRAGTQVVLMAADQDALIRIAGQLSPKTVLDPKLIVPAVIAHDQYVNELESDL